MKNRKSRKSRQSRRRRFLFQLLASISISAGATAMAQEAEHAYYAPDRSEMTNQVRLVSDHEEVHSILQTQALQNPIVTSDVTIKSSSDIPSNVDAAGDVFLLDAPVPVVDPVTDDIDAVVEQALTPVPLEQPFSEATADALAAPVARRSSRPSLGAVAGSFSAAPNMMGDFFGSTASLGSLVGHTLALAGGDRRIKVAENTSPIPQDRVFFNYNHFHNALIDINDVSRNLDRFTFGIEKTFWDGMASIESRLPFASALDTTQAFGVADTESTEFGNISTSLKVKLLSGCDWVFSGGATLVLPTGDDFELFNGATRQLLVQNDAVHLSPFVGFLKSNRSWFAQGFIQADFDLNGNDVFTDLNGFEGVLQDQNLLFMDVSLGHWFIRNCDPCARLSGVAAIAELHYTTTMQDTDSVAGVSNNFNRMDILNATGALNFQFQRTSLRIGAAAPLRGDEENLFDAEILVQLNRNF